MKRGVPKTKVKTVFRETTRLTYAQVGEFLESSPFMMGCEMCIVQIHKKNKVYRILDIKRELCFGLGTGNTTDELKRNARKKLMECSASVFEEVRVRK